MTAIPLPRRGTNEQWLAYIPTKVVVEENGCHSYRGRKDKYPMAGRQRVSRRLLGLGPGDPRQALHTCDVDWCVNIEHLYVGTQQDNIRDMHERRRWRLAAAKLTDGQVAAIREDPRTQKVIAAEYGVDPSYVSRIKSGRSGRYGSH